MLITYKNENFVHVGFEFSISTFIDMKYKKIATISGAAGHRIYIIKDTSDLKSTSLSSEEKKYASEKMKESRHAVIRKYPEYIAVVHLQPTENKIDFSEQLRRAGYGLIQSFNNAKKIAVVDLSNTAESCALVVEGMMLGGYQFSKYLSKPKKASVEEVQINSKQLSEARLKELDSLRKATLFVKDLVNEPANKLSAVQLSRKFKERCKEVGVSIKVLNKENIATLRMGGLMAVNQGSKNPPTFSILEWKPANAKNKKPVVLVGKGVTFDTGGMNIKTGNYMDNMKDDMSGAAVVAGVITAIASQKLPIHVVALAPATDNRTGENAYVPGDIISMHNGTTVEIGNTDAEGRLIMADALSYAKKYNPSLTIDVATLTGAAAAITGPKAAIAMGNAPQQEIGALIKTGNQVYERVVQLPFWDEYADLLKSPIADIKNIGGKYAGAITAGKFLEHFTSYPYIHVDIAGVSFSDSADELGNSGATGFGVRLLYYFLKNKYVC